ncbi:hypothetical protein GCM10009785_21950 [Brooklawnia cerclae]|uniref:Uncharacterized protein YneF (UPF0154 family) n=1 Tax=Brooklawnia cerclae TaxID=349934 RepID=A0ABX0SK94_9ACTN|nr:hypothetical protein [Brooklawnia cerclae]NIH57172.1 uncharacterized protein YneF (UPF0154 family) [Brooklawnia cerclae]
MTTTTADFVPYEYLTLQVDRELEPLYRDTYHSFGWAVEGYGTTVPKVSTVTLKLKRDRRIHNRRPVLEQQRVAEQALATIASLEHSKQTAPVIAALTTGIIGSAFLAGSVFAITANLWLLGIPLGLIGLVGWVVGYFLHGRVKASQTAKVNPLIDREYETIYAAGEQASQLLAA